MPTSPEIATLLPIEVLEELNAAQKKDAGQDDRDQAPMEQQPVAQAPA
jgi:hypothetical protein